MIEGAPGRLVGDRYHIVRELGRGGMGVVYLGRDLRLDMDVAIKFRGVTRSDATLWLKREFRAVASLRHPNLVELYELVAHDRSCYFTMEYVPGVDPRRWVEHAELPAPDLLQSDHTTRSALPLQQAHTEASSTSSSDVKAAFRGVPVVDFERVRVVLAQLAEGLAFLHSSGVIHRDVKPSNTLCVDGVVKLLDFGLALERRRQDEDVSRETRVVGTAAYLAPEYLEHLTVGPAMDVYSLGVVAFELVTGAPPFGGSLLARLQRQVAAQRASEINPAVPRELDRLIDRMLAPDPADRPTASDVATALTGNLSQPHPARRAPRFVGRDAELARVAERVRDPAGHARLVLVAGPSGVGKTTLIAEAASRARDQDTLIWRGRCHERERVPYRAFDLIVDDLATGLAGDPRLAHEIEHVAALCRVFPVLAPPIDPAIGDEPPVADLRVERERALLAMTQLFRHLLRAPRGVVVIDDLQWADDDSLELLALLVERVDKPLTVIASWTTDGPLPAAQVSGLVRGQALLERLGPWVELVELPAMTDDQLACMIADLAPGAPSSRLAAAARLAAGSPYLAELIGRELGDADLAAPSDVEHRRLGRLDPDARAVAEIAALAGRAVSFEQLREVAGLPSSRLQPALRGLEDARIVRATPSAHGDPVYVLYHQRLGEVAHQAMSPDARRARHHQFAEWFERHGEAAGDAGQLAYHWQHAGDHSRAATWAIRAAEAARAQLAWSVAEDWYARALDLIARTAAGPDAAAAGACDPIAVRAGHAEMLLLGGKLAPAADEFIVVARSLHDRGGGDHWRVRAAEAYLKLGEIERGLGVLDDVLERRGQRRSRVRVISVLRAATVATRWLAPLPAQPAAIDEVLAASYRVIASFLSTPYPVEALEYVVRGIALAERTGDRAAYGQGMAMLAAYLAAATLGRFGDRALASASRAIDEAGAVGSRTRPRPAASSGAPYAEMVVSGCTGILAMLRGDWTGMRTANEDGQQICRRLGLERSWEASFLRSYWALGELYAGEPARALVMLAELTESADDLFTRAMLGSYRGRALVLTGELAAARTLGRELERSPAARRGMASIHRQVFAAELALAEHDWRRAGELAAALSAEVRAQWLSIMPAVSAMVDVIAATADLGRAANDDRAAAGRVVTVARRILRRGRSSFYAVTALRLWGQGELLLGNHGRARGILDRATAAAELRGGKVDRLALRALTGAPVALGPLGPAVAWATGGIVATRTGTADATESV